MAMSNSLHFHTLEHTFREAAQTAKNAGDVAAFRAFNVLAVVCSYHFNPSRPQGPLEVRFQAPAVLGAMHVAQAAAEHRAAGPAVPLLVDLVEIGRAHV